MGYFYYLPLTICLWLVKRLKKKKKKLELEPNRKLFCDHLPFIHCGVLVGQGSLCGPFVPQLKMDDFCNAKGSEVYMAYMFILMLLSLSASLGRR